VLRWSNLPSAGDKIIIDLTLVWVYFSFSSPQLIWEAPPKKNVYTKKQEKNGAALALPVGNRFYTYPQPTMAFPKIYANLNLIWLNCLPRQLQPCKWFDNSSMRWAEGRKGVSLCLALSLFSVKLICYNSSMAPWQRIILHKKLWHLSILHSLLLGAAAEADDGEKKWGVRRRLLSFSVCNWRTLCNLWLHIYFIEFNVGAVVASAFSKVQGLEQRAGRQMERCHKLKNGNWWPIGALLCLTKRIGKCITFEIRGMNGIPGMPRAQFIKWITAFKPFEY